MARPRTTPAAREPDFIEITGAREHNLDIPRLTLPKRSLIVFTGVSGSGKSSLAFDTLYAEGQRRYVETLSAYARQFLGQMERPHVEHIRGLSPTIAIEQKSASGNPRSTVGTITEVYDYLRVLYARAGTQRCVTCGKPVASQSADEIARAILERPAGTQVTVLAPLARLRKGEFKDTLEELKTKGFVRVEVDSVVHRLDTVPALDKKKKHTLRLVVDRLSVGEDDRGRLIEAVELGLREGKGEVDVDVAGEATRTFSEARSCCGVSYPEPTPQSFSFNSPLGMCKGCSGLGARLAVDPELIIQDPSLSLRGGVIAPWASALAKGEGWTFRIVRAVAKATGADLDAPWKKLTKKQQHEILHGIEGRKVPVEWGKQGSETHGTWGMRFEGVIPGILRRYHDTTSETSREGYRKFMREQACAECGGRRLRAESLAVELGGVSIAEATAMPVAEAQRHFQALELSPGKRRVAEGAIREVHGRLKFLVDVGLDYLTLDRSGPTLSGGEAQRIRLASQLGSELSGVMYVLDEPSIGLHQRDNDRLISTLCHLRDLGNTVLVVEHDEETIRAADHVVDFGPGAGHTGGKVVFEGTPAALAKAHATSLTGAYLAGKRSIPKPEKRRPAKGFLEIIGAEEHNLQGIDVRIPLGNFVAVTGVSGAGKSSLINGILLPALAKALHDGSDPVGAHKAIRGLDVIDKAISIDQRPIGRTPRSNPGTYTKIFDQVREVFAMVPDARARGFTAGRFSFNVKGGRCEACGGDGSVKVEMHFLADVFVTCEVCAGRRYNAQTLAVRYKGLSIADVLDRSVDDCLVLFEPYPNLKRVLTTLRDVGLGYMKIGQPAPTLSGGEAQRVKLSRELGKVQTGKTLYVLDEPTTGLHFEDVRKLLGVLQRLVELGNSVVVIEHNLDVVMCADWVIDLGPEGGARGGLVVAEGTPEQVAKVKASYTGQYLARMGVR
jgi:excinuclease ABC subunit A